MQLSDLDDVRTVAYTEGMVLRASGSIYDTAWLRATDIWNDLGWISALSDDESPQLSADLDGQSAYDLTNIVDGTFSGTVTVDSLTDGTSTLTGGEWSCNANPGSKIDFSGNDIRIFAEDDVFIRPSGDSDDYFQLIVSSNIPTIAAVGGDVIKIDDNLQVTGGIGGDGQDFAGIEAFDLTGQWLHIDGAAGIGRVAVEGTTCLINWGQTDAAANKRLFGMQLSSEVFKLRIYNDNLTTKYTVLQVDMGSGDVTLGARAAQLVCDQGTGDVILAHDLQVDGGNIGVTGDTDLLGMAANALTVNGTVTATSYIGGAADNVATSICPNRTGDGSGIGIKLFENTATGENPALAIYGYYTGVGQRYATMYVDIYGRLSYGGDVDAVVYSVPLGASDDIYIHGTRAGFIHRNTASSNAPSGHITFSGSHDAYNEPTWVMTEYARRSLDFDVPTTEYPQLWLHDGSATVANVLKLYHDTTDGVITSGLGDVKIDDNLNVTGNIEIDNTRVITNQQAHIADATTQDLAGTDTINETNLESDLTGIVGTINSILTALETHGLLAAA